MFYEYNMTVSGFSLNFEKFKLHWESKNKHTRLLLHQMLNDF